MMYTLPTPPQQERIIQPQMQILPDLDGGLLQIFSPTSNCIFN